MFQFFDLMCLDNEGDFSLRFLSLNGYLVATGQVYVTYWKKLRTSYSFLGKLFKNSLNNTHPNDVQTYSPKYPKFAFSLMMFLLLPRQKDVDGS